MARLTNRNFANQRSEASPTRGRGRPCGLTAERERILLRAIRNGQTFKTASAMAGISYMTFNRWRQRGTDADAPAEFRHFCDQLSLAQARAEDKWVKAINKAAQNDWRAAAYLLERRNPSGWSIRRSAPILHVPIANQSGANGQDGIAAFEAAKERTNRRESPNTD